MKVGQIVTIAALKKEYDGHFSRVLGEDYLVLQERQGKEHPKYKVVSLLPTKTEYNLMKVKRFTTTVETLIEDAYSVIEELADEMQEAYENTPESLQNSDIGQRRQEAADSLSNIDKPDLPTVSISTVFFPALNVSSRAKRASEAADMLTTASTAIREYIEETLNNEELDDKLKEDIDGLEELADKLEEDSSELESIEFPGMYGN